jgi:hypothetical protein
MAGTSKLTYSSNFGTTLQDKTGSWVSAIGAVSSGFNTVIPLY